MPGLCGKRDFLVILLLSGLIEEIMLSVYVEEFVKITEYLFKSQKYRVKKDFLIIEKKPLEALLNKNKYDTASNKLKIWKGLNWIDTETDRVTKRVYIDGNYVPCIKISLRVWKTLKNIEKKLC